MCGAALAALAAGAWFTGWPQERSIEWQIRRNLGAVAVVDWGGLGSSLWLRRIEIYPDVQARRERKPIFVADNVAVAYRLLPNDDRMLRSVLVERASLAVDVVDPAAPNYAFLTELLSEMEPSVEGEGGGAQFVPRELVVEEFDISLATAQGRARLGRLRIDADLLEPQSPQVNYASARSSLAWESSDGEVIEIDNVTVDGLVALSGDTAALSQKLDAPGLAYSVVEGAGDFSGDSPELHMKVGEFTLAGGRLAAFLDAIDSPLRFDELDVESGEAVFALADAVEFHVKTAAHVHSATLAAAAEPLYADIARIEIDAEQAGELHAEATLTLAQRQIVHAVLSGNADAGSARITSDSWTRDQLVDALPEAFRSGVSNLGFDTFTANADVEWTEDRFNARANASSQGGGSDSPPIHWKLDAQGPRDTVAGIEGVLEAQIGERRLHATATSIGEDRYRAEARIETVQLAPWVELVAGDEAAARVLGTIEGTVTAEMIGEGAPIEIVPDIRLRAFGYNELILDEIALGGTIRYEIDPQRLTIAKLRAEAIDGMTLIEVADVSYDAELGRGEAKFSVGANRGVLESAFGAPDLYGSGEGTVRVRVEESMVYLASEFTSNYSGFGEILMPYGSEITGQVEAEYDVDSRSGTLTQCDATLGTGTELHLTDTTFATEPVRASGRLVCESDLQLLVAMAWLQAAEGTLRQEASFEYTDEGMSADWELDIEAASIVLAGAVGSAENARLEGDGTYRDGLDGTGTIRAAKITAAGGSILDAEGPVAFTGDAMEIHPARGALFGGEISANIDIGVFVEKLPIALIGSFHHVDLAILTDEVKPPNTSLTGTAVGSIEARYTSDGLELFALNTSAPEGLSVNRSLVADLLQSEKLLAGVGERVVERTMDKLLGSQPQRPFDTGRLEIFLNAGKIQGMAELLSVKTPEYNGLNLTVNLDMDQSALAQALTLLEESKVGNVDF